MSVSNTAVSPAASLVWRAKQWLGEYFEGIRVEPLAVTGCHFSSHSENYLVRWGSKGFPKEVEMLNNLKVVFTVGVHCFSLHVPHAQGHDLGNEAELARRECGLGAEPCSMLSAELQSWGRALCAPWKLWGRWILPLSLFRPPSWSLSHSAVQRTHAEC